MVTDTTAIKQKIIESLQKRGPSLPVHIAKDIEMSSLFTSAFLSELLSEQKIKSSHMKVGGSKIFYLSGQEPNLEKYAQYLNSKEKEAFNKLKEEKFLIHEQQEPAIKVALQSLRDFAKSFEKDQKLIWRFFTISTSEYPEDKPKEEPIVKEDKPKEEPIVKEDKPKEEPIVKEVKIKETSLIQEEKPKTIKKTVKKKTSDKKDEKFFNKVKEFLTNKQIEISDIIGFAKGILILKIKSSQQEKLLIAYNKKRITEKDILDAFKKSQENNLDFMILSLGEPTKKLSTFIEATKKLDSLEILE